MELCELSQIFNGALCLYLVECERMSQDDSSGLTGFPTAGQKLNAHYFPPKFPGFFFFFCKGIIYLPTKYLVAAYIHIFMELSLNCLLFRGLLSTLRTKM